MNLLDIYRKKTLKEIEEILDLHHKGVKRLHPKVYKACEKVLIEKLTQKQDNNLRSYLAEGWQRIGEYIYKIEYVPRRKVTGAVPLGGEEEALVEREIPEHYIGILARPSNLIEEIARFEGKTEEEIFGKIKEYKEALSQYIPE